MRKCGSAEGRWLRYFSLIRKESNLGVVLALLELVMTVLGLDSVNTDTVSRHPPLNKHTFPVVSACDYSHCS